MSGEVVYQCGRVDLTWRGEVTAVDVVDILLVGEDRSAVVSYVGLWRLDGWKRSGAAAYSLRCGESWSGCLL